MLRNIIEIYSVRKSFLKLRYGLTKKNLLTRTKPYIVTALSKTPREKKIFNRLMALNRLKILIKTT